MVYNKSNNYKEDMKMKVKIMFTEERQKKILTILGEKKSVSVKDLTGELSFSPATIRSDLNYLSSRGLLIRTHGGATAIEESRKDLSIEENFLNRKKKNHTQKVQIAKKALSFIQDSNCIILDASSTCYELAILLNETSMRLTVLTNGLKVATLLKDNPLITVILIGGVVKGNSNAIEGLLGVDMLYKLNIDYVFLSPHAFNLQNGLTDFNLYEVELKKKMVEKSQYTIALVDDSKLEHSSIASFASVSEINTFITNSSADSTIIGKYKNFGVPIVLADSK